MLDEKDLQAIAQIMDSKIKESEQRTAQAICESEHRTMQAIRESEQRTAQAIRESEQRTMQGASTLMSRVDELEEEVAFLRSMIRQHSREIEALKHA